MLPGIHFHECSLALLLHKPTSKDTRPSPQPVMICFPRVCVLQPECRAHCSQLPVADGTVAHRLQRAWGERVTLARMPMQVLGMGAPRDRGDHHVNSALSTGCAPTLLAIHPAGDQASPPSYYHSCIKAQAAASQQASARPLNGVSGTILASYL